MSHGELQFSMDGKNPPSELKELKIKIKNKSGSFMQNHDFITIFRSLQLAKSEYWDNKTNMMMVKIDQ